MKYINHRACIGLLFLSILLMGILVGCDLFEETYILTVKIEGTGTGTVYPAEGEHEYDEDAVVDLTAISADGSFFKEWDGDVAEIDSDETTVVMDADKLIVAIFDEYEYKLIEEKRLSFDLSDGENSLTLSSYGENDYAAVILFPRDDDGFRHSVSSLTTEIDNDYPEASPESLQKKADFLSHHEGKLCATSSIDIQQMEMETLVRHPTISKTAGVLSVKAAPEIGDTEEFNIFVEDEKREAVLKGKNEKALLWVTEESKENVSGEDVQYYLDAFAEYYNDLKDYFGREPVPDDFQVLQGIDSRVNILFSSFGPGGYFYPADLYSADDYPSSNEGKIIYINSDMPRDYTAGTIAHEYQHLLFFNEKALAGRMTNDVWINEGFSELAQDIAGYGYQQGVGEFKVEEYITEPYNAPLISWEQKTRDYGASYLFARYIYDNFGRGILNEVSTSSENPKYAIENYSGIEFHRIFEDWAITLLFEALRLDSASKYTYSTITIPDIYGVIIDSDDGWNNWSIAGWGISYTVITPGSGEDLSLAVDGASTTGEFWKTVIRWSDN